MDGAFFLLIAELFFPIGYLHFHHQHAILGTKKNQKLFWFNP